MPTRTGLVPESVSKAFEAGLFSLPSTPRLGVSAVSGTWSVPVILVDFPDQPLTHSSPAVWERALFDTTGSTPTGSVYDYYQWASGRRFRVVGKVVATVHLDNPKSFYGNNSWGLSSSNPQNIYGAVLEALMKCDTQVNWSDFDRDLDGYVDMVWVVHSGLGGENTVTRQDLWSITSKLSAWTGGGAFVTSDPVPSTTLRERVDAFATLPEMSAFHPGERAEIGVFCHEFGHALGLPDLYDTAPISLPMNVGPGGWSLMATGAYGADGLSPEYPSHLGAWPTLFLGWGQATRPTRDTLLTLAPLENGGDIVELWFQGEASSEHFLLENRQRLGFDRNVPGEGVIVYQVDDLAIRAGIPSNRVNFGPYPGLRVIEGDGRSEMFQGINRGDASDPMPGTTGLTLWDDYTTPNSRSRLGSITNVALRDITPVGDDVRMLVQVRARGWQPSRVQSAPGYQPVAGTGPGTRAVLLDDGGVALVASEVLSGIPQVVLRSRRPDGSWETPFPVSQSSARAVEPTICALPGGDLCVAWSDARHGPEEIYFRSRVRGVWTGERRLTDLAGVSRGPTIASDGRGGVQLAWLYNDASGVRIEFMRFTYLSPFGDPVPVSQPGAFPAYPALAMAPDRSSYIVWMDRAATTNGVWFAHFHPDSGVRPARRLVQSQSGILPTVHAAVDHQGTLNVLWALSGASGSELRFHAQGVPIRDTAVVRRGEPIQDFMIAVDPQGGRHVVMEAVTAGSSQILYKEWHEDGGWDIGSTEVTSVSEGVAVRPTLVARQPGSVTVLYTRYDGSTSELVERDRNAAMQPLTDVAGNAPATPMAWRVSPNPLRRAGALRLSGREAASTGPLEVYDLSGRRVATTTLLQGTDGWRAEIPASETRQWPSGIYFVRLSGTPGHARVVVLR